MPINLFLRIDGIDGESTEHNHSRWIDLVSFEQQVVLDRSNAGGTLALAPSYLCRLAKLVDISSPKLALACCSGQVFEHVVIEGCRAGGNLRRFVWWSLADVIVTSVRCHARTADEENRPIEEFVLACQRVEWSYAVEDARGAVQGNIVSYWDFEANVGG